MKYSLVLKASATANTINTIVVCSANHSLFNLYNVDETNYHDTKKTTIPFIISIKIYLNLSANGYHTFKPAVNRG